MVMAGKQASDVVLRRFAYVRLGVVRVSRELPVHVIEVQPLAQMLARRTTRFASCGSSVRRRTHAERHDRAGCPCKTIGEPTCSADVLMCDRESAPCRR